MHALGGRRLVGDISAVRGLAADFLPLSAAFRDSKVIVQFDHAIGGLVIGRPDGVAKFPETATEKLNGFELMDAENVWRAAEARIDGQTIVVTSSTVPEPVAVRYACHPQAPEGKHWNLYNRSWLPAPVLFRLETDALRPGEEPIAGLRLHNTDGPIFDQLGYGSAEEV